MLSRNNSKDLKTIVLAHLSDNNANEEDFKRRVELEVGTSNVYVASKGLDIEL